jgi:hypothetical protein
MSATCIGFLFYFICETPPQPPDDTYCQIARPIFWSQKDSRATKIEVDTHNRIWKQLCAEKPN